MWHWHSHCTRARFTVLVSCNDEIAVRSCPILCLQGQVANLASGLFYCWFLQRNNNTAINLRSSPSNYGRRRFSTCDHGSHCGFFSPRSALLVDLGVRGVTLLDGAEGKKQVWRPHVRMSGLLEASVLYWRKYLWHSWDFSAYPVVIGAPMVIRSLGYCAPLEPLVTSLLGV